MDIISNITRIHHMEKDFCCTLYGTLLYWY